MVRDIAIDEDTQTTYNVRGDISNANDLDFVRQSMVIGIEESVDMSPPSLQDVQIEEQRGDIERAVKRNQFTEAPISVTVEFVDYEEQTIQYNISTSRISDTISTT